ncbi:YqcC family protein [Pseudomonas sp. SA3-5]|uniref:YqcC family protein n=1 Tax=Pseudomonas aestuarii TaxID=3018340 RepID=A0ABT4XLN8_9PSED|nr:YqcC family protein [Pseudomonas aestuarii]MDA7089139.1 YqcC family protein [Pseudomonas aestuarii]
MDARVPAIAQQLLLIERELRLQGWWDDQAPSDQALASQQPFCVDTLAFEQWLQWIFLPRMKNLLESGAPLPEACGIQPMAEQVYGERSEQARVLIRLLGEFDQLICGAA